jgi:hypothetical protein
MLVSHAGGYQRAYACGIRRFFVAGMTLSQKKPLSQKSRS